MPSFALPSLFPTHAYASSELMREVAWVIYDEIHYMRDKERGVVWEESIILLPHKVRFVFLSATIPNAKEFAEWIAHVHAQPCHVVYTEYRPTPLQVSRTAFVWLVAGKSERGHLSFSLSFSLCK